MEKGWPHKKRPAPKGRPVAVAVSKRRRQNWYFTVAFTVRPGSL